MEKSNARSAGTGSTRPWSGRLAVGFLLLFALAMLGVRFELIARSLPYPLHVDEETFSASSLRMLRDGGLRPIHYNWPTLPIYLALAAESFGYLGEALDGKLESRSDISLDVYPRYVQPGVVLPAKHLFAAISVATLVLVGLLARGVTGSGWGLVLAPVVLSLNTLYFEHSWRYLNVDIVGCFFVVLAIGYLILYGDRRSSIAHSVVIPGVLCGLAMASKYTHGAVALPFLISLAYKDPSRLLVRGVAFIAILGLTFAIAMPYAVLDWDAFSGWILRQRGIYNSGWPGHSVEPGLPHLSLQLQALVRLYGVGAFGLGMLGLAWLPTRGVRRALLLSAYPVAFVLYFSSYRVDFVRNLLPVHGLFAVFVVVGIVAAGGWLERGLRRIPAVDARGGLASSLSVSMLAVLTLALAPWGAIASAYSRPIDSRTSAIQWIRENVPAGSQLVVAREIGMALRPLRDDYEIVQRRFATRKGKQGLVTDRAREAIMSPAATEAYFIVPKYGHDQRWPEREAIAEALNSLYASGDSLAEFGDRPVLVRYLQPVPTGNPEFSIRRGVVLD